ncbi:MAG: FG-GAP repeat domain-containing protein, partial [Longimicrobiales bacterium]
FGAACAGASGGPPAPAGGALSGLDGGDWERVVYGIDVTDASGVPIDHPFLGGFNLPRPQLADLDGDGDLELFLQELSGEVMLFENVSAQGDSEYQWRADDFESLEVGEWFRFVDVDLDGDLDVLAEEPFSYIRYYRNDGGEGPADYVLATDTLKDISGKPVFSDRQNIPNAADIDCDGNLDLLIGRLTGTITRYEAEGVDADGVPQFRHVTDSFEDIEIVAAMQGSLHGANTMALGDVDQDGDDDLFWGDFFEAGLLFIENTGSCERPVLRGQPRPFPLDEPVSTSGYNAPALGDLDQDGDLDLLMGVLGGAFNPNRTTVENLYRFNQAPGGGFGQVTERLVRTLDVGSESAPAFVDLDQDGDLDLLISNKIEPNNPSKGALFVYENTGSTNAPAFTERGAIPRLIDAYHYAPVFGDLDGDGDADVLMGGWQDQVAYYRNDGVGIMPDWTLVDSAIVKLTRGRNTTPALADVDGDGDLDLFVGEASGALNFYRNEGGVESPVFTLVSDEFGDIDVGRRSAPTVADLNGDGVPDLLIGSEATGLHAFQNQGLAEIPAFQPVDAPDVRVPSFATPVVVDLNGDGRSDLVVGGGGGGLHVYLRR